MVNLKVENYRAAPRKCKCLTVEVNDFFLVYKQRTAGK